MYQNMLQLPEFGAHQTDAQLYHEYFKLNPGFYETSMVMNNRPPLEQRCFTSPAIEHAIADVSRRIGDPEIAALFVNCFPNTLDTTVTLSEADSDRPDTFVVTGDIDAMW